jgi:haloacetate dehalogenase
MQDKISIIQTDRCFLNVRDTQVGFPLVMIHGWPESSYSWEAVLPYLTSEFRCIRPDLLGMGDSERTLEQGAYLKQELAKDILAVLDQLGISEFALVGHDWGGAIAQELAFLVPDRIKKLGILNINIIHNLKANLEVLEANKTRPFNMSWYQTFMQQTDLADQMIPNNEKVWLAHFLRFSKKRPFPEHLLEEYVRTFKIPNTATTSANLYRTMAEDVKHWITLAGKKHPMPMLYIYGKRDVVIIPEYLKYFEDCFEDFQIVEVDAGHFVQDEEPEIVGNALLAFLKD